MAIFRTVFLLGVLFVGIHGGSVALGNLAVVMRPPVGAISTVDEPLHVPTSQLWCQASRDKEDVDISWGRFIHLAGGSGGKKIHEATITDSRRAHHDFVDADVTEVGKYRCEVRTDDGELVFGNMFVYLRPTIHHNDSITVTVDSEDSSKFEASSTTVVTGGTVELECPVIGYPEPNVLWFKDNFPVESTAKITFVKNNIQIEGVEETDAGNYRCVATNSFPQYVDGPEQQFEIRLEHSLNVSNNYGWLVPLIVILIILLLLFITIYACQACKHFKSDNYDVGRHERDLRKWEEQKLREEHE